MPPVAAIGADDVRFRVSVLQGTLVRIFDNLKSNQDVYVHLVRTFPDGREQQFARTATCHSGDLAPKWDDERFEVSRNGGNKLKFMVYAEHFWRQDYFCGQADLDFDSLLARINGGSGFAFNLQVVKKGEPTGTLSVSFSPCELRRASSNLPALCSSNNVQQDLERLLHRPEELEERVRIQFQRLAGPHGAHGQLALRAEDCDNVRKLFGEKLGVGVEVFGEIHQMFWRFEVAGDGRLYEDEATRMLLCMLRQYRDSLKGADKSVQQLDIKTQKVSDNYDTVKELGRGGQGIAYLAKNKSSGQEVVLKMYAKANQKDSVEEISKEFALLLELKHPKIARVFEIFQDWSNVYIVQEPYFGGDLTKAVQNAYNAGANPDERWVADVMLQVCVGVEFLHKKGVIHSDLKEPNVMVASQSDWRKPQVIVIDFGLANKFSAKSGVGGTPGYMPPEVWDWGLWTPRGDVFSIGVMLFTLRTGKGPFNGPDGRNNLDQLKATTKTQEAVMDKGSDQLKALVQSMLHKKFLNRPHLKEIMQNPWFQTGGADQTLDMQALKDLTGRRERNDLYRALLADVAARQNMAQLKDLNETFIRLDKDNDGMISAEELREGLAGTMRAEEIEKLIGVLGAASGTGVSYDEFLGELLAAKVPEENLMLMRLFDEADVQKRGYLGVAEMEELAKRPSIVQILGSPQAALARIRSMDTDGSGRVSFDEFKRAVQGFTSASMRPNLSFVKYIKGQSVLYYSASYARWVPCVVTEVDKVQGVQVDCKPGLWLTGATLHKQLKPAEAKAAAGGGAAAGPAETRSRGYREGQPVVMWSTTYQAWIPCKVTQVDANTGAVVVDQKPGYWLRGNELATRIKPADAKSSGAEAAVAAHAGVGRQLLAAATGMR
mmetsp:Transcript_47763/g.153817  ORF Transcript_47763/g.153817 Transcript_47763/m.153817 type:complete len:888 (-) Transcript_47763:108-2771(-)